MAVWRGTSVRGLNFGQTLREEKRLFRKAIDKYKSLPKGIRASFWFLICAFLQKGISSITTPIFTRLMSTEEYGQFGTFNSWLSILTTVITLHLYSGVYVQGLVKFEENKKQFSSAMQGLTLTLCSLWTVVYIAFMPFWNGLFKLTSVQMLSMLLIIWTSAVFQFWAVEQRVELRYRRLVILTFLASLARPVLAIILMRYSDDKVTARILGMVIVDIAAYAWLFFIQMRKGKTFFSGSIWKYAVLFNLPLIPHYLSMSILSSSDRIMITNLVGEGAAGIYNLAYNVSLIMTLFNTALLQTVEPWLYKKIKEKRITDISTVAYPAFIIIALVNLLLMALAPEVITVFGPPEYHEAIWVIPPVAMSVFFMFAYTFFAVFEFYYEKTKFVLIGSSSAAVLNVVLNYIFIRIFGYIAAAYTTLICYALYAAFHYVFMRRICNRYLSGMQPYSIRKLLALSGVFVGLGFIFLITYHYPVIRYGLLFFFILILFIYRNKITATLKKMIALKKESGKKQKEEVVS